MTLTEIECGMTAAHIHAVEALMKEQDAFLFLRPTEYDSTVLIKEGFATKSMDIHDKSSNWGPMAGMVPCDPAFSKKRAGTPNPAPHYHAHGEAEPVHLVLPTSLYARFHGSKFKPLERPLLLDRGTLAVTAPPPVAIGGHRPPPGDAGFFCEPGRTSTGDHVFCMTRSAEGWQVWWVHWADPAQQRGRLVPLQVWAYKIAGVLKPVTGDYDLWMVAPRWRRLHEHSEVASVEDSHGKSAATAYITTLIKDLNAACKCPDNPVFRHGAESQNYGFTQSLDARVAMFTPAGTSRMVERDDLPQILGDIQNAGYLAYWNKRYGEIDPKLSGKAWFQREESAARSLRAYALYRSELAQARAKNQPGKARELVPRLRETVEAAREERRAAVRARFRFAVRRVIAQGDRDIRKFHNDLMEVMRQDATGPVALRVEEFGDRYLQFHGHVRRLMAELQKTIVAATSATGTGETDEAALSEGMDSLIREYEEQRRRFL